MQKRCALFLALMLATAACVPAPVGPASEPTGPASEATTPATAPAPVTVAPAPRPRPEIPPPPGWPSGKRIVLHVTPSLEQSFVVACDLPAPALTYLAWGHQVTIVVDRGAVTAFRRDASGKSPLDRLELLPGDLDELADVLHVPRTQVPSNFGALYAALKTKGVRIVAADEALRAAGMALSELDPTLTVVPALEVRRIMSDLDAFVPYDDLTPFHSIWQHRPAGADTHGTPHLKSSPGH